VNLTQTNFQQVQTDRTVLDNGIVVLVRENPVADIVSTRIFIRSGSRWEVAAQAGLAHLVAAVLTKGTKRQTALEIAEQVESVGAGLGTDSTVDYFLLSLKTVTADFSEILSLAGELLRSPTFPEPELELERKLTLQAIRSQREQPFTVAFEQLRQAMYGNHPYALSGLGTEATVAELSRADLLHYHQTHFRPDNLVISLSGRIERSAAIAQITQVLGDWQAPVTPLPTLKLPEIKAIPVRKAIAQDTQQAIVMLGYLAPGISNLHATASSPDYIALKLLSSYLGNGLSSRLFVELREKLGLAYEVSAFYPTRLDAAQFVAYMGTAPENTAIALQGLQTEVDRLRQVLLSPTELQAAKNKVLGQYALGKQTNAQLAQTFGWYETLGLGIEFDMVFPEQIAAISAAELQQAAQNWLTEPFVSLVGPATAVNPLVS
jgi:predicted Zn-dependent peptidase